MLTQYPYVDEDARLGGIMQASYRLVSAIDALADKRITLCVLTHSSHISSEVVRTMPNGTSLIFQPLPDSGLDKLFFGYPPVSRALKRVAVDGFPDVVHGQGTAKYIYAAIRCGRPHIITVHGIFRDEMKVVRSQLSLWSRLERFVKLRLEQHYISRIANLIAISPDVAAYVKAAAPAVEVFPIDNAIDESFFSIEPLGPDHPPAILFVAAITYRKGLDLLLAAFLGVLRVVPQATLHIAGIWDWDLNYVQNLRQQYQTIIAQGSVEFLGGISQEQLIREMANSRVLCLPSRAESAPMVISQAMAAARPVVASRVGGIPNMITDGVSGRLWDIGNISSLSRILVEVLTDSKTAGALGRRARAQATGRYSAQAVASKTIDAYVTVAQSR